MSSKSDLANTLFPLGYAEGPAFCNREKAREDLKQNIMSGTHTYITGMRRYGKTSLIRQVSRELARKRKPKVHSHSIDLLTVHTLEALEALLRDAVGKLSGQFLPKRSRILGSLARIFSAFAPKLVVNSDGSFSVELFSKTPSNISIQELLTGLDEAALHYKRRAVLIIDEFQQISQIDQNRTIEASIRNVAQGTKAVSFVFLGSERSALKQMFAQDRPMFNAGSQHLELDRISKSDYSEFLQKAATLRWGQELSETAKATILAVTDRHTYYVNVLCRDLWKQPRTPSSETVIQTWTEVLARERHQAYTELMALAHAQKSVLQAIAVEPTSQPTAKSYLGRFDIAGSTMKKSLSVLVEKDFVRITRKGVYELVDPLIRGIMDSNALE